MPTAVPVPIARTSRGSAGGGADVATGLGAVVDEPGRGWASSRTAKDGASDERACGRAPGQDVGGQDGACEGLVLCVLCGRKVARHIFRLGRLGKVRRGVG